MIEKDKTVIVDKTTICYDECGQGDHPVLFVHGFPFDKTMWQPQMDFLETRHRALAFDLPGFGKSARSAGPISISVFADELIQFMDLLEIEKFFLCGLSMGGYIALNAAYRYRERLAGLILSDTQCIADTHEVKEKRKANIKQVTEKGMEPYATDFVKNVFSDYTFKNNPQVVERIKKVILDTPAETVTATLHALAERWEMCSTLEELNIPVMILCGSDDRITPVAQSVSMHEQIKHSTFKVISNAGHLSNLEQPEIFNEHLEHFLEVSIASLVSDHGRL